MKAKLIALLLICVVISITFGNDDHKTHHNNRKIGHPQHRSKSVVVHHQKRTLNHHYHTREKIGFRNLAPNGLELYLNGNSSLIAFENATAHTAAIFSYSANLTIILNGESGSAIGIDSNSNAIIKLNNVWVSSQINFGAFFQSLSSLQNVIQSGQISNDGSALHELNRLAFQLGTESNALETLLAASKILNTLRDTLKELIGHDHFHIRGGLLRCIIVFKGICDLFREKPDVSASDPKRGINLDLPSIINAPNGLQALLRILQSLGRLNLSSVIGSPLMNLEILLKVIVELGGNDSESGIDNIFRIIFNILEIIRGRGSIENLVQVLLETGQDGGVEINGADITPVIDDLLKLAESQNTMFRNSRILNTLIRFLRDLNSNNLFLNDVNISRLLLLLRRGDFKGAIDLVIRVFVRLNNVLNPTISIPRIFGLLLSLFNSTRGGNSLPSLLPGVDPSQVQVLQSLNVTQLLQNRDVLANISQVPIVGQLYTIISSSLGNASNGSLNLEKLLNANGGIIPSFNQSGRPGDPFSQFTQSFGGIFNGFGWLNPLQSLGGGNLNPLQNLTGGGNLNPLQNLTGGGNLNPLQNLTGGGNLNPLSGQFNPFQSLLSNNAISVIGQLRPFNTTNVLMNSSTAYSSDETEHSTQSSTTDNTTLENFVQNIAKIRNHHGHFRKESKNHHRILTKTHEHYKKHFKHEKSHEKHEKFDEKYL